MAFATGKELAPSTSSAQPSVSCHHFEFPEILIATENFSESLVIGRGGFGKVYNSNIINGSNVVVAAIKHLDSMSNQGAADLWAEVEMLSMLWHFQGDLKLSTNSKDINMLSHVKEVPAHFRSQSPKVKTFKFSDLKKATRSFSPDLILGEGGFGKVFLGWVKENTLAPSKQGVGMAVAVKRLNKESTQGAAEWQNFNAKLGGFGLARYNSLKTGETYVTTPVTGTYGYAAPEYIATGHLTTKCDIYSFGVVLLVSITGQKAMDVHRPEGQQRLVEWATHIGSNIKKIMDPCLEGKYPRHGASEYVALALRCVADNPKHRPSAEEVLQSLEQIYATQKYK
ncbi:hypothetical protein R6Q59_036025 [Mikania micrantha]